jgi:hypothetical protein
MTRPMAMERTTIPSIRSVDLSLAGLRLPAGSWASFQDALNKALARFR